VNNSWMLQKAEYPNTSKTESPLRHQNEWGFDRKIEALFLLRADRAGMPGLGHTPSDALGRELRQRVPERSNRASGSGGAWVGVSRVFRIDL